MTAQIRPAAANSPHNNSRRMKKGGGGGEKGTGIRRGTVTESNIGCGANHENVKAKRATRTTRR